MPLLKEGRGWQWSWVQEEYGASKFVEEAEKMWWWGEMTWELMNGRMMRTAGGGKRKMKEARLRRKEMECRTKEEKRKMEDA
jgi:hypothetical protein